MEPLQEDQAKMKRLTVFLALAGFGASLVFSPGRAWAGENERMDALIHKLVEKGVLTDEEAQAIRNEVTEESAKNAASRAAETKDTVKGMAGGSWVDKVKWSGDLRLRAETQMREPAVDRTRERFRLRFGFLAKPWDPLEIGVRLATGTAGDPLATNQSFGASFDKKAIFIDQAYGKYTPWKGGSGPLSGLSLIGGKMENPFATTPEGIVWDSDVTPEGAALQWKDPNPIPGLEKFLSVKPFVNGGAFQLSELSGDAGDPAIFGGQLGADINLLWNWVFQPSVAYYDFTAIQGSSTGNVTGGALGNTTTTGTKYAYDYNLTSLQGKLSTAELPLLKQPVAFLADFTRNENDKSSNPVLVSPDDQIGCTVGMELGKVTEKFGSWKAFLFRKRVESDASLGALTDSDFGGGGTNHKGYILGAQMGLNKWASVGVKYFRADEVDGTQNRVDTLQADLQLKY